MAFCLALAVYRVQMLRRFLRQNAILDSVLRIYSIANGVVYPTSRALHVTEDDVALFFKPRVISLVGR